MNGLIHVYIDTEKKKKKENDIICITVMHAFGDNAYVITQLNAIFKIEMITI